jgi:environmental stress-induced protein Ves
MRIIRAAEHRVVPWKNGGGLTREVLVEPDPADPAQFLWRISIATVAEAGPFSRFPGIDRSIAVLGGEGMRLYVEGEAVTLLRDGEPFRFSGDAEVRSELIAGETIDLNVMTRRDMFRHRLTRIRCHGPAVAQGMAQTNVLLFTGPATVAGMPFDRFDSLVGLGRGEKVRVRAEDPCEMFVIGVEEVGCACASPGQPMVMRGVIPGAGV